MPLLSFTFQSSFFMFSSFFFIPQVFTHIVRESIVTKLKHIVILGYVIGCDIRKLNNNTGLRIYVESQFPPTTVNEAIEECLAEMEEYLRTLNHADFKIHVNALKAVKMESHMKMYDFASMLWREVTETTYDFRRHHRESEHLNFLTLSKVRSKSFEHICATRCDPQVYRFASSTRRTSTPREPTGGS